MSRSDCRHFAGALCSSMRRLGLCFSSGTQLSDGGLAALAGALSSSLRWLSLGFSGG